MISLTDTKPLPASAVSPPPNPSSRLGLRTKISSTLTTGTASTDLKRKKPASSDVPGKSNRPRALKLIQHIGQKTVKGLPILSRFRPPEHWLTH